MSSLKAGSRLKSAVCDAEVMVVRAAEGDFRLCCGGAEMIALATAKPEGVALDAAQSQGTLIGKRYADAAQLEFLAPRAARARCRSTAKCSP
jgi:hypothetical protein